MINVGFASLASHRMATVEAYTKMVCLTLRRDTFTEILGPLEKLMTREKSPQVRVWFQPNEHFQIKDE
jgi:CRP-like cAMP-binding protein